MSNKNIDFLFEKNSNITNTSEPTAFDMSNEDSISNSTINYRNKNNSFNFENYSDNGAEFTKKLTESIDMDFTQNWDNVSAKTISNIDSLLKQNGGTEDINDSTLNLDINDSSLDFKEFQDTDSIIESLDTNDFVDSPNNIEDLLKKSKTGSIKFPSMSTSESYQLPIHYSTTSSENMLSMSFNEGKVDNKKKKYNKVLFYLCYKKRPRCIVKFKHEKKRTRTKFFVHVCLVIVS